MLKKFRITVEGTAYNVLVEELPTDAADSPHFPAAAPQAAAIAAVTAAAPVGAPPPAAAPAVPTPAASPAAAPVASGAGEVTAPLAGVVDSIEVRVGQSVAVGDRVAVIEAMKMKTDVFAKVAGTVQRVAVKSHDSVDTGQALLSIG